MSRNRFIRNRKAQVQMGETIVIVVIVILLIVFGMAFYYRWAKTNIQLSTSGSREEEAFATATIVANLPELSCSRMNIVDLACYDTIKISAMRQVILNSKNGLDSKAAFFFYNSLFKNANVTIYEIYPKDGTNEPTGTTDPFHLTVYDNPPANYTQKIPARVPITLYDPITDTKTFGIIEVVRYY